MKLNGSFLRHFFFFKFFCVDNHLLVQDLRGFVKVLICLLCDLVCLIVCLFFFFFALFCRVFALVCFFLFLSFF